MIKSFEALERRTLLSGELDSGFGSGGLVTWDFGTNAEQFSRVAVAGDGKVYAAGVVGGQLLVTRYTATGVLDSTFATGGVWQTIVNGANADGATGLAVRGDGEVFVGLQANVFGQGSQALVLAISPTGGPDGNWGLGGGFFTKWGGSGPSTVAGLAISGNWLYVAGSDGDDFGIARVNANTGQIDPTFGTDGTGRMTLNTPAGIDAVSGSVRAVDLQVVHRAGYADRLLMGGGFIDAADGYRRALVAESALGGTAGSGLASVMVTAGQPQADFNVTHVAADALGRILVAGDTVGRATIERLTPDGSADIVFGTGGLYSAQTLSESTITSLTALRNGEVVYSGPGGNNSHDNGDYVYALTSAGQPNAAFSPEKSSYTNEPRTSTGLLVSPPAGHYDDVAVQADGKLVFAGANTPFFGAADTAVMRLSVQQPTVTISGTVYNDRNADGVPQSGEPGLTSGTAYVDLNRNGLLDTGEPTAAVTNGGFFLNFAPTTPGSYAVGVVYPSGFTASSATNVTRDVVVPDGGTVSAGAFLAWQGATVTASAYEDADADGTKTGNDQPLVAPYIYADLNNNGVLDSGEPNAQPTTANGLLAKLTLKPGTYTLRASFPAGYTALQNSAGVSVTLAGGIITTGPAFGGYRKTNVTGTVYRDVDGNGSFGNDAVLANRTVYADANGNGLLDGNEVSAVSDSTGKYTLSLNPGTYMLRQVLPTGWIAVSTADGTGHPITVQSGYGYFPQNFGSTGPATGTIYGYIYNDVNGDGVRQSGETAIAPGTQYLPVYLDTNQDGVRQAAEPTAFPNANTGVFVFPDVNVGSYVVRLITLGNNYRLFQTAPGNNGALYANVFSGASSSAGLFGVQQRALTYGYVIRDTNGNGVTDKGETGVQGDVIYVDNNNDGVLNGGDLSVVTGANGYWSLDLPAGTYTLRQQLLNVFTQSGPAGNAPVTVTVPTGALSTAAGTFYRYGNATDVYGYAWNDTDHDGIYDNTELGAPYRTIYADENNNGVFDSGDISTTTDSNGGYKLTLYNGRHTLRQVLPTGVRETGRYGPNPPAGATTPFLSGGVVSLPTDAGGPYDFGSYQLARVGGFVVSDTNGNGVRDTGENALTSGAVVYVDANNNGRLDTGENSFTTSTDGFWFYLDPGTYTLRQQLPAGYVQTSPTDNAGYTVTIPATPTTQGFPVYYFLRYQPPTAGTASISGTVYGDANLNEDFDAYESGAAGRTVFLDTNNDGLLNSGEASTVTAGNGTYSFAQLPAGSYNVRAVVPPNLMATNPTGAAVVTLAAGEARTLVNFGQADYRYAVVSGRIFYDANRDGVFNEGDSALDGDVYVDTNANGTVDDADQFIASAAHGNGTYSLKLPATGSTYKVLFDNVTGYTPTTPSSYTITPAPSTGYGNVNFGVGPVASAATLAVSGVVYTDANKNYKRDAGEAGVNLVRVYVDLNNNGVVDDNEPATYTNASGAYAFPTLAAAAGKSATVRIVLPAGYTLKYPSSNGGGYVIPLTAKTSVTTADFGVVAGTVTPPTPTPVSVTGLVYTDANKNGVKDAAETALSGVTVFADTDGDGVLDANEARAVTSSTGTYTLSVPAAPLGATATAVVRAVLPGGYTQTAPVATPGYSVTLTTGAKYTAKDFGLYKSTVTPPANTASLSGLAFNDVNKNGVYDGGDTVAAGKTVWLDLDDDGVLDSNEQSAVTDSAGKFGFKNLAARSYHVRRVFPSGYVESTPARYVTLASGQAFNDVRIGSKAK